jgi:hypothetical protein
VEGATVEKRMLSSTLSNHISVYTPRIPRTHNCVSVLSCMKMVLQNNYLSFYREIGETLNRRVSCTVHGFMSILLVGKQGTVGDSLQSTTNGNICLDMIMGWHCEVA